MTDLSRDPVVNAVNNGIRRGIQVALDSGAYGSAVILIYSGIDSMAYLDMPAEQEDVTKGDFIRWADRYIEFPCEHQVPGADLYGARCAMLHNYSVFSRMSRKGACRVVGYMDHAVPEVVFNPEVNSDLVLISVRGLAEAYFRGIDRFLVDAFSSDNRRELLESRLRRLVQCLPFRAEAT